MQVIIKFCIKISNKITEFINTIGYFAHFNIILNADMLQIDKIKKLYNSINIKYLIRKNLMKKLFLIFAIILLSAGLGNQGRAQDLLADNSASSVKFNRTFFTVPAGVSFRAINTAAISSANAYAGQVVSLVLDKNFYYNNGLVAPAGSLVSGSVTSVSKAKDASVCGKMALRYTSIVTPDGLNIPISAVVKTRGNTGEIIGDDCFDDLSLNYIRDAAYSSAISLNTPTPMFSKSGSISRTVGDGGGLVKSIWSKGGEVEIPANISIELVLTQPITVKIKNGEN